MRLSRAEFEKLVSSGLRRLPPRFRRMVRHHNLVIVVETRPSRQKLLSLGMNPDSETLFGLYEGVPLTDRSSGYNMALPDKITLYQAPLESSYPGYYNLKEQVRRTLFHEIAHFFGIDDATLDEMGWG